jgi:hypothetical protein
VSSRGRTSGWAIAPGSALIETGRSRVGGDPRPAVDVGGGLKAKGLQDMPWATLGG